MSAITTHVLDTTLGRPAAEVPITLERQDDDDSWMTLGHGKTDRDGRLANLLDAKDRLEPGIYRLTFYTGAYFASRGVDCFYPAVQVAFDVKDTSRHYHVPLLLNPFGYTTYRGS